MQGKQQTRVMRLFADIKGSEIDITCRKENRGFQKICSFSKSSKTFIQRRFDKNFHLVVLDISNVDMSSKTL